MRYPGFLWFLFNPFQAKGAQQVQSIRDFLQAGVARILWDMPLAAGDMAHRYGLGARARRRSRERWQLSVVRSREGPPTGTLFDVNILRSHVSATCDRVAREPKPLPPWSDYAGDFLGYDRDELSALPPIATARFAGVGNLIAIGTRA